MNDEKPKVMDAEEQKRECKQTADILARAMIESWQDYGASCILNALNRTIQIIESTEPEYALSPEFRHFKKGIEVTCLITLVDDDE